MFQLIWIALQDFTLRILLVASVVSIIVKCATADEHEISTAWVEGFAIFVAVAVCASVAATVYFIKNNNIYCYIFYIFFDISIDLIKNIFHVNNLK